MALLIKDLWVPEDLSWRIKGYKPQTEFGILVKDICKTISKTGDDSAKYMAAELIERISSIVVVQSSLHGCIIRANGCVEPLGLLGYKVVTDVGVGYIVDAFQNLVELENQKFHGIGTGSTAEAAGETALVTELTTEYNPDSTRATGTTTEQAANIYKTVATNTLDGTPGAALREHGIFSAASAGVLLDRTLFAAITLSSGDGLQTDYRLTLTSGG